MTGFFSPIHQNQFKFKIPTWVRLENITLPARKEYHQLASETGDKNKVLLICGYWGQGPILKILKQLLEKASDLEIYAICGENLKMLEQVKTLANRRPNIKAFPVVNSLVPYLRDCASVITKPGISTLLEAHAAERKIFLLKGMPVAEDNNARYAINHFGAEWYDVNRFLNWLRVPT